MTPIEELERLIRLWNDFDATSFDDSVESIGTAAMNTDLPAILAAYRIAERDRMRGSCRLMSVGNACECGLCTRDKAIADLQRKYDAAMWREKAWNNIRKWNNIREKSTDPAASSPPEIMAEIETQLNDLVPGMAATSQAITVAISDLIEARIEEAAIAAKEGE